MIRVVNADIGYGDQLVLKGVNIEVKRGITVLKGANGSGKTTLCKSVSGLIKPLRGLIEVDGVDIYSESGDSVRREIVYVHDKPVVLRRSLWDNIVFGLKIRGLPMDEAYDLINRFSLKPLLNVRADKLSSGYRKLATIVRALVLKPKYLILDEPLNYLDSRHRMGVLREILDYARDGGHILVATHTDSFDEHGVEIYRIIDGEVRRE